MNIILKNWRDYCVVPSGETIRAFEIVVITAALEVVGQVSSLTDIRTYAVAAGIAGLNAGLAFIKGHVGKPAPAPAAPPPPVAPAA